MKLEEGELGLWKEEYSFREADLRWRRTGLSFSWISLVGVDFSSQR